MPGLAAGTRSLSLERALAAARKAAPALGSVPDAPSTLEEELRRLGNRSSGMTGATLFRPKRSPNEVVGGLTRGP